MPVSQALAARHGHNQGHEDGKSAVSIHRSASGAVSQHGAQSNPSTEQIAVHQRSQKPFKKNQCASESGHKGRCSSCLCTSLTVALTVVFPIVQYTPTASYRQLSSPLHSIFITPPFRPPIV